MTPLEKFVAATPTAGDALQSVLNHKIMHDPRPYVEQNEFQTRHKRKRTNIDRVEVIPAKGVVPLSVKAGRKQRIDIFEDGKLAVRITDIELSNAVPGLDEDGTETTTYNFQTLPGVKIGQVNGSLPAIGQCIQCHRQKQMLTAGFCPECISIGAGYDAALMRSMHANAPKDFPIGQAPAAGASKDITQADPVANAGTTVDASGRLNLKPILLASFDQGPDADCYLLAWMISILNKDPYFFNDIIYATSTSSVVVQYFYQGNIVKIHTSMIVATGYNQFDVVPGEQDVRIELIQKTYGLLRSGVSDYTRINYGNGQEAALAFGLDMVQNTGAPIDLGADLAAGKLAIYLTGPAVGTDSAGHPYEPAHAYGVVGKAAVGVGNSIVMINPWYGGDTLDVDSPTLSQPWWIGPYRATIPAVRRLLAPLPGDVNADGKVDIKDLTTVTDNWQVTGVTPADGDTNKDGVVDVRDLTNVSNEWQKQAGVGRVFPWADDVDKSRGWAIDSEYLRLLREANPKLKNVKLEEMERTLLDDYKSYDQYLAKKRGADQAGGGRTKTPREVASDLLGECNMPKETVADQAGVGKAEVESTAKVTAAIRDMLHRTTGGGKSVVPDKVMPTEETARVLELADSLTRHADGLLNTGTDGEHKMFMCLGKLMEAMDHYRKATK